MALGCPRCKGVSLEEIELEGVLLDRCFRCAGLWFDHDEVSQMVNATPTLKKLESVIPSPDFAVASLTCPRCQTVALREFRLSGGEDRQEILVYRCASCSGSWLDRGQLRYVEDGGIADAMRAIFGGAVSD